MASSSVVEITHAHPHEPPWVPGKKPWVGHLHALRADFLGTLTRAQETADVAALRVGPRVLYVVSSPVGAQRVLVDNARNYSKDTRGYQKLRETLGNGLVTSQGAFWLRQRRIAQPAFHREKIMGLAAMMQRSVDAMLERWTFLDDGGAFDFSAHMMKLTMRIIGEALFSVDVSEDVAEAGAAIEDLMAQVRMRTLSLFDPPHWVPTPMNRRFRRHKRVLDELVLGIISKRRAGDHKMDLLSMLLESMDPDTGERMSDAQLRDEVLTLFSAGHETTSMALSWTMHELVEHDDIAQRLRAELQAWQRDPKLDGLLALPYLDAVLKEAMRLHPPIPNVARGALAADEVCGYAIAPGANVLVAPWAIHRNPRVWPDPLRFDPTRFLAADETRHKLAYMPFIAGPRKCIGDALSVLEAKIILATLMLRARFTRVPGHRVVPVGSVSLRMRDGLKLIATRL